MGFSDNNPLYRVSANLFQLEVLDVIFTHESSLSLMFGVHMHHMGNFEGATIWRFENESDMILQWIGLSSIS